MKTTWQRHDGVWWCESYEDFIAGVGWDVYEHPHAEVVTPEEETAGKLALMSLVRPGTEVAGVGFRWAPYSDNLLIVSLE